AGGGRGIGAGRSRADVPFVLLSSMGSVGGGAAAARGLGFDAALTKPVGQATLCETVANVLGQRARARAAATLAGVGPTVPLRVLVAEDNAVSRDVLLRMLDRLGCHTAAVDNAQLAVDAAPRTRHHP